MTAERIATALQARRSGKGWMTRCVAHEDRSPSLSVRQAGDTVLVHCFAGCPQEAVIDALRARGLWPEREREEWTPAQRADWAQQQREIERDLPDARYWRAAAVEMTEEWLTLAKSRLFDPLPPPPEDLSEPAVLRGAGIYDAEQMLTRLRAAEGADLVGTYRSWCESHPGITAGMVRAARAQERAAERVLRAYMRQSEVAG